MRGVAENKNYAALADHINQLIQNNHQLFPTFEVGSTHEVINVEEFRMMMFKQNISLEKKKIEK